MDAKRKAALIKELSAGKGLAKPGFDPNYTPENRVWFVTAVVEAILTDSPTPPDSTVPAVARLIINDANKAVADERDLTLNLALAEPLAKIARKDTVRRVEIIYGIIAENEALADTTRNNARGLTPMRQFLTRRRYRAILRMIYQVNPNGNGFMRYPDKCDQPPGNPRRLNFDAQPLWEKVNPLRDLPFKVKGQDPAGAVAKIWERPFLKGDECKGNLLDCAAAACCMLLDSLGEASNRAKFYEEIRGRGPTHFLIINPNLESEKHCLWDKPAEPKKVFTKEMVEDKNFQVGDHVVVENHGLYASVMPGGFWVSEHSLVTNCGNRDLNSGRGMRFGGHGVPQPFTISEIYDELIKDIQTGLHRTFKIADLFLRFRKNPATIPASQFEARLGVTGVRDPRSGGTITLDAFKISSEVTYENYNAPPVGNRRRREGEGKGDNPLVIFDMTDLKQIAISPKTDKNTIDAQLSRFKQTATMTFLKRDPESGGGYYDPQFWKVMFDNSMTSQADLFPVFGGTGGTFKLLERKDMPKGDGRYFRAGFPVPKPGEEPEDPDEVNKPGAMVTRPTNDSSDTYLTFLSSIGGIVRQFP